MFVLVLLPVENMAQTITGTVFRDFNANGVKDNTASFNEVGIGGVTVNCTDSSGGTGTATTSTAATTLGQYSLTGCTGASRVDFVWTNAALFDGAKGAGSNTSIQFINATRTNINFGLNNPAHYSNTSPNLVTPKYLNGNPLAAGSNLASDPAFYRFPYTATGNAQSGGTATTTLATQAQIGTTWGVAYSSRHKKLFMASAYKRHAGLGPGETGGRIFVINDPNGTPSAPAKFIDLVSDMSINVGAIETNSARGLGADKGAATTDNNAFTKVGKVSLGDLDISDDEKFLFVTNLHDRKIYKIDIDQVIAGTNNATALPDITATCTAGVARPWGLGMWDGELYAGIVCTAETGTNTNLRLFVQKFNFTSNAWTTVLTATPDWDKGDIIFGAAKHKWQKWEDSWNNYIDPSWPTHPQPIIGDIEFDEEGSMHLAVLDRLGFQTGHRNLRVPDNGTLYTGVTGGELLRTYKNPSTGVFSLESNGTAGPYTSGGTGDNSQTGQGGPGTRQGPGGGEFYADDHTTTDHSETTNGGLTQVKGTQRLASIQMDPIDGQVDASGVLWFNINNGLETQEYQIFYNASAPSPDFSKQNGLGDLEALSLPAPIEIGNRVWLDTDNDGIQDAGEA
ncbi:MAG TPA: hypothetical protein PLO56_14310, partial [Rhodothermales bacterium]|nr:hypothetical protein [Rhodothermales bacterium]